MKFRIWAIDVLKDYIRKGFKIDVEQMKQGEHVFSKDYFRELLEQFVQFVQVSAVSGNKSLIFLQKFLMIMIKMWR